MVKADTRAAIETLVTEFSFLVDHGHATDVPDLFIEQGTFESPAARLQGKAALTAAMAQRAKAVHQTRHAIGNLRLTAVSADQIRGNVLLTMYRWMPGETAGPHPIALMEYEDVYQRDRNGEWRFASRKVIPVLPPAIQDDQTKQEKPQ